MSSGGETAFFHFAARKKSKGSDRGMQLREMAIMQDVEVVYFFVVVGVRGEL